MKRVPATVVPAKYLSSAGITPLILVAASCAINRILIMCSLDNLSSTVIVPSSATLSRSAIGVALGFLLIRTIFLEFSSKPQAYRILARVLLSKAVSDLSRK